DPAAEHRRLPPDRRDHAMNRSHLLSAGLLLAALGAFAQTVAPPAGRLDTQLAKTPPRVVDVDRIVAVVNDEVITQNDLNQRVNLVVRQLQRQGAQLPPSEALNKQSLERMINDMLQVQMAKENGIKV